MQADCFLPNGSSNPLKYMPLESMAIIGGYGRKINYSERMVMATDYRCFKG